MKRVGAVVLGAVIGWAVGIAILLVVSVVLVGMGIAPERQIIGVGLAMLAFMIAGGLLGFRLSRPRAVRQ